MVPRFGRPPLPREDNVEAGRGGEHAKMSDHVYPTINIVLVGGSGGVRVRNSVEEMLGQYFFGGDVDILNISWTCAGQS